MYKILCLFLVFGVFTSFAQVNLDSGLVAWYPFNGNANDESGNGNNGVVNGATLTSDRFGNENSAYSFDGNDDYIDMTDYIFFNTGQDSYTISQWLNISDITKASQCSFNTDPHTGVCLDYNWYGTGTSFKYFIGNCGYGGWNSFNNGVKSDFQNNIWFLFTAIKDGTNYRFYINGVNDNEVSLPIASTYNCEVGFILGRITLYSDEFFKGNIDETRIYNRALSEEEILALYNEPPPNTFTAPILTSPLNNSINQTTSPAFQWQPVINALSYHFQVSTNQYFSEPLVIDEVGIVNTNFDVTGLANNTQYYWRVCAADGTQISDWSEAWNFTIIYEIVNPPGSWAYTPFTGNDATVIIPVDINPTLINIPFNQGDAIGVFYTNENNQLACAGYVIWNNSNLGLVVRGDNETTEIKDGFAIGEVYTFKVWDGQYGIEHFAAATFSEGTNIYQVNGFSVMSSLTVLPPLAIPTLIFPENSSEELSTENVEFSWSSVENALEYSLQISKTNDFTDYAEYLAVTNNFTIDYLEYATTYFWKVKAINGGLESGWSEVWYFSTELASLEINLNSGWNTVSSFFTPFEANLMNIFSNLTEKVKVIKNGLGQICVPEWGINQIGNWNVLEGYQIYVTENCSFIISGEAVVPENTPIQLSTGWHLVSYLRSNPMPVVTALQSISGSLIFAKNGMGLLYHPGYGINTLGNMQPGQGYWLYMAAPAVLTYPGN